MQNQRKRETGTTAPGEIALPMSDEVVLKHEDAPPKGPPDKRIHGRRPLPLVPEKSREEDEKE
jgi:hypothetical protein